MTDSEGPHDSFGHAFMVERGGEDVVPPPAEARTARSSSSSWGVISGLLVTYTIEVGTATLAGNTVTFSTSGFVRIRASPSGDAMNLAAPDVTQTVLVESPSGGGGGSVVANEIYLPLSNVTVDTGNKVRQAERAPQGPRQRRDLGQLPDPDGTALAGVDYTATTGTLTFATGVLAQTVSVAILAGANPGRLFSLKLSNPVGATVRPPASRSVTITGTPPISLFQACGCIVPARRQLLRDAGDLPAPTLGLPTSAA